MLEFHLLQYLEFHYLIRSFPSFPSHNYIWEFHKIIGFFVFQPQNVRNMMKHLTLIFKNHIKQVGISPITSVHYITQYTHRHAGGIVLAAFFLIRITFSKSVIIEVYRSKFEYVLEIGQ